MVLTGHNDSVTIRDSRGTRRVADRDKVFQKRAHCAGDCWSRGRDRQVTRFTQCNKSFEKPMAPSLGFFLLNGPNRYSGNGRSLEGPWKDPYLLRTSSTCQLILLAALNLAFPIATAIFPLFARLYRVFPPVSIFPLPIFHRSTERFHLFCSPINRRESSECTERFSRDKPPIRFLACKKKAVGTLHASPCRMCTWHAG